MTSTAWTDAERKAAKERVADATVSRLEALWSENVSLTGRETLFVGLGTGSTAKPAVLKMARFGEKIRLITGVPTSKDTAKAASEIGIKIVPLEAVPALDVGFDGADFASRSDPNRFIKGGGGAQGPERLVAEKCVKWIIMMHAEKMLPALGVKEWVPIEVRKQDKAELVRLLAQRGVRVVDRTPECGRACFSDAGNPVVDAYFPEITDSTEIELRNFPIVAHGIFTGLATEVLIANKDGTVDSIPLEKRRIV